AVGGLQRDHSVSALRLQPAGRSRDTLLNLARRRPAMVGVAMAVLQLCFAGSASAHPHVFIDNQVVLQFEAGVMTGFRTDWRFDEIFTEDMWMQFDADGDGQINAQESDTIAAETLPNLAQFHYFTHVAVDGEKLEQLAPSGFLARVEEGALHF